MQVKGISQREVFFMEKPDLVIRKVKLPDQAKIRELSIKEGMITDIADSISGTAANEINAGGRLAVPPFVDLHVHQCCLHD